MRKISAKNLQLKLSHSDRGNELFAVRVGQYKAHLWTWSHEHYNFCPGEFVEDVTTPDQVR